MNTEKQIKVINYLIVFTIAALPIYYLRFSILGVPTNLIELLVLTIFILVVINSSLRRKFFDRVRILLLPLVLITLGLVIALIGSDNTFDALGIIKSFYFVPIIFGLSVASVFEKRTLEMISKTVSLAVILVSSYSLLVWLEAVPIVFNQSFNLDIYVEQLRAVGFFESPNFLAMYLVPFVLFLSFYRQKNLLLYAAIVLGVITVLATQSRGGGLALLGALLVWLFLTNKDNLKVRAICVLGAVAGAIFLIYSMRDTDAVRMALWQIGATELLSNPIFGVGFDGYKTAVSKELTDPAQIAAGYHPHNFFIAAWLSTSIFGLVGMLGVLWVAFKKRSNEIVYLAILPLVSILIHGLVDTTYFKNDLAMIFWFFVAVLIASSKTLADKKTS